MNIWQAIIDGIMAVKTMIAAVVVSTVAILHPHHAGATIYPYYPPCSATVTANCQMVTDNNSNLPTTNGFAPLFNTSGMFPASYKPRTFDAQVVSDTTGNFTVDTTNAGFTAPPHVQATAISTGTGNQTAFIAIVTSVTTTQIVGKVLTPATIVVGGNALEAAKSAVPVSINGVGW